MRKRNLPLLRDRTRELRPLDVALRWFVAGISVDRAVAADRVPAETLAAFVDCGLLAVDGDELRPQAMVVPYEGMYIATDRSIDIEAGDRPDIVLGVNRTTWLLHRFMLHEPVGTALDLGSGSGALALEAAAFCDKVTATDLNERAIALARFNVSLNLLDNVECLVGDTFEPVADRSFDRIYTNPPFFVTPSSTLMYCENDMELDGYCRRLTREAPAHLNEGGFLQMVCEWPEIKGQELSERLAEWVEGIGCDAWILKGYGEEVDSYAHKRLVETTSSTPESDQVIFEEWMRWYRDKGVRAIHGGMIALRKRSSGSNWIRIEEPPSSPREAFGHAVAERFAMFDLLHEKASDEALLGERLVLHANTVLHRDAVREEGKWKQGPAQLRVGDGIPAARAVDALILDMISLCDGRPLGVVIDDFAERVSAPVEQVRAECLALVRKLAEEGFLAVAPEKTISSDL